MDKFTSVSVWNEERVDNTSATDKRKHNLLIAHFS